MKLKAAFVVMTRAALFFYLHSSQTGAKMQLYHIIASSKR